MKRDDILRVMESWYELAQGDQELLQSYEPMMRFLRTAMPDEAEAAASVPLDGTPAVLALAGDALFLTTLKPGQDGEPQQPVIERIPLMPAPPTMQMREAWRGKAPALHVREWTLKWPDGRRLSFESIADRAGRLPGGPDAAEGFARALASQIGWTLPA